MYLYLIPASLILTVMELETLVILMTIMMGLLINLTTVNWWLTLTRETVMVMVLEMLVTTVEEPQTLTRLTPMVMELEIFVILMMIMMESLMNDLTRVKIVMMTSVLILLIQMKLILTQMGLGTTVTIVH